MHMSLLANPSHLEAVDPVVLGKVHNQTPVDHMHVLLTENHISFVVDLASDTSHCHGT